MRTVATMTLSLVQPPPAAAAVGTSSCVTPLARVRSASADDLGALFDLFRTELVREPAPAWVASQVQAFPSAVAYAGGALVGFAYATSFAPDVLELVNIVVSSTWRDGGVGTRLLTHLEAAAGGRGFAGVIVVNSDLYPAGVSAKRPATAFYLRAGYRLLTHTTATRVLFKDLI